MTAASGSHSPSLTAKPAEELQASLNMKFIFLTLCCLSVQMKSLDAKTLPEQETVPVNASDVQQMDFKMSLPHGSKHLTSEDPVKSANVSVAPAVQKPSGPSLNSSGGSVQPASALFQQPIEIPLSLSPDSVDDMYHGCSVRMLIKVKRHYLPRSTKEGLHTPFTESCALRAKRNKDLYDQLSLDHFRALCAYTAGSYADLNRAVRQGKDSYRTSFEFHALHFLLSDAIRLLKVNQRSCYTTFRRSKLLFMGKPGQNMRFGSFASSSLNSELRHFGEKTCFEIHTCYGAYLKSYSELDSDEDEVLIPPYEMFNIVSADMSGVNHLHCDVLYKLETAGIYSNLNCQIVHTGNR